MPGRWSIEEKIIGSLPVTIELGLLDILISLLIALPVGIYSAIRQDTAADYAGRSIAIIGLATPNFWLGIMVMTFPAIWWGWSPPMEVVRFTEDPLGNLGVFLIPSLILGTAMAAATMQMTRIIRFFRHLLRERINSSARAFSIPGVSPHQSQIHA